MEGSVIRPHTLCVVVPGSGGIIGLFSSDRARINSALGAFNADGYRLVQFSREIRPNILNAAIQLLCLVITLLMWCPVPGGLLFLERDIVGDQSDHRRQAAEVVNRSLASAQVPKYVFIPVGVLLSLGAFLLLVR